MRITTKGSYAVMALLDVALHQKDGPVSLIDISCRHKISQSYLEQLFSRLRKNDLVKSVRGPGGGYIIQKDLDQLTVAQVILAINETPLKILQENCQHGEIDLNHSLWKGLSQTIHDYLKNITYAQLIRGYTEKKLNQSESFKWFCQN